jgi:hypothetical protein
MPTEMPFRVSIPVSSFPHRTSTARPWTGRHVIGALLGIWAAAAALLAAAFLAIVWDLRP